MKFKKYLLAIFIFPTVFILFFMAFDPYGVFLRRDPLLFGFGMRIMAANAIDSGKYDSYLLGSSMLDNASARECERLFGGRFANITLNGSTYFERAFVLNYICNKEAKRVIYSIDDVYQIQRLENKDYPSSIFSYLYDNNWLNNLKVYFSISVIKTIQEHWASREKFTEGKYKDYDSPYSWFDQFRLSFGGLENLLSNGKRRGAWFTNGVKAALKGDLIPLSETHFSDSDLAKVEKAKEYCYEYILKFVETHPSTDFYLFFPPYSRTRYAYWYRRAKWQALVHQHIVRYFAEMAANYPNLHVYGFEDQSFLDDISLYMDPMHYHPTINTLMNKAMAENTNMLTPENVGEYLRKSEELALQFDLKGLAAQIDDYLKKEEEK